MIIKSAFRDYYDNVSQHGLDPNVQFLRGRTTYQAYNGYQYDLNYYSKSAKEMGGPTIMRVIIGFVDTLYCCRVWTDNTSTRFNLGDQEWPKPIISKVDYDLLRWPRKVYSRQRGAFNHYWGEDINGTPIPSKLQIYGPIFVLEPKQVVISPKLSDYGFAKVVPPVDAYRRLYQWVCNQRQPVKPIPEMPNDVKIEQAGFDLKHSFRKGKVNG